MIYYPLFKNYFEAQVRSKVNLDDYKLGGAVHATTCNEAAIKWMNKKYLRCTQSYRDLQVGDLLRVGTIHYVLTPNGQWAVVEVDECP